MMTFATVQQSAALPYRIQKGRLKVLLITSIGTGRWILPKGHIEPGLSAAESAEAEALEEAGALSNSVKELTKALEEAGVVGNISRKVIGSYNYKKRPERGGERCRVRVFAMEVTRLLDHYPEAALCKRRWGSIKKAIEMVQEARLKELLVRFEKSSCRKAE